MIELSNKKILILGASGFIGRQTAIKLSQLGARLVISGRDENKLTETFSMLEGNNHNMISFDLASIDNIMDFMKSIILLDNQKLDGLVFCPAISTIRPLKSVKIDFLHNLMNTNYYSFIEVVKCFSNKKICEKGSIVTLSSIASINGEKGQLAYSATKAAMDSSVNVIAKELKNKKIRINSIRPAALLPKEIEFDSLPPDIQETIKKMKTGPIQPDNIAEHIAFLISDYSSALTGKCFDVRGYLK